ncbi:hypothetical protein [Lentilactobacillus kisonensis]
MFREPRITDGAKQKYTYTAKIITKYFGNQKLSEITTTEYQQVLK